MCLVTSLLDWPWKRPQNEKNSGEKKSGEKNSGEKNSGEKKSGEKNSGEKNQVKNIWVNGHLGENLQVEKKSGEW